MNQSKECESPSRTGHVARRRDGGVPVETFSTKVHAVGFRHLPINSGRQRRVEATRTYPGKAGNFQNWDEPSLPRFGPTFYEGALLVVGTGGDLSESAPRERNNSQMVEAMRAPVRSF